MSKIRNKKTEEGQVEWFHFRKPKFKKRSLIRKTMWIAKMIGISADFDRKIEEKRKNGTLITKRFEYGDEK